MPPVMHLLGDGQRVHFPFGLMRYECYIMYYVNTRRCSHSALKFVTEYGDNI